MHIEPQLTFLFNIKNLNIKHTIKKKSKQVESNIMIVELDAN